MMELKKLLTEITGTGGIAGVATGLFGGFVRRPPAHTPEKTADFERKKPRKRRKKKSKKPTLKSG